MIGFYDLIDEMEDVRSLFDSLESFLIEHALDYLKLGNFDRAIEILETLLSKETNKTSYEFLSNWIFVLNSFKKNGFLFDYNDGDYKFITFDDLVAKNDFSVSNENSLFEVNASLKGKLYVPDYIETISKQCFYTGSLKEVILPKNLKHIEEGAFKESYIQKITIPEGIGYIPKICFRDCYHLEEVNLPKGLYSIQRSAFKSCTSLKKITFNEGLERIDALCFSNCSNLETIQFKGNRFRYIGEYAFENCRKLKEFTVRKDQCVEIDSAAFAYCNDLVANIYSSKCEYSANSFYEIKELNEFYKESFLDS